MSAIRKSLYYLWKKLSEKQSRKKYKAVLFKPDFERYATCTNRKPARWIKQEMQALHQYWGCYPFQYYRFDFYKNDCTHTVEDMKKYVPHFFAMNLFFPLSYMGYGVLCEDKLQTYAVLKAFDVLQPRLLFCYDGGQFWSSANNPLSENKLDDLLLASTATTLFVKPRFGLGGKGIIVFNKDGHNGFVNEEGHVLNSRFFAAHLAQEFYIVQEGLSQHAELSAIYPQAVNTYRIITECKNGDAKVLYCVVRLGSGGRQIDNASAGGIFVRIDLDTGMLYPSAQAFDQSTCTQHPDTGFVFKDATLQTWVAAKAFTIATARKFRDIRYLGWDIAVTKDGPAVIEINNGPDISGIQDSYGGIRDDLHINPRDWWFQSAYTLRNL